MGFRIARRYVSREYGYCASYILGDMYDYDIDSISCYYIQLIHFKLTVFNPAQPPILFTSSP